MEKSKGMERLLEREIIKISKLFAAMDQSPQDNEECIKLGKELLKHNNMLLDINTSDELKVELNNINNVVKGVIEYFTDKITPDEKYYDI